MRLSPQPTVKPERRYGGAKYPTLIADGRTRRRRKAKTILSALLGIFLGLTRRTEATDTAKWTFDEPSTPPDVKHPIHGIHYATACRSGPVWDSSTVSRPISLKDLGRNPGVYRNELIRTRGILRRVRPESFGERKAYCIVDSSTGFELWLLAEKRNSYLEDPTELCAGLVGQEIEVVGELKIVLKRFVEGFENVTYRFVWGIDSRWVRSMTIRAVNKQ